MKMLKNEPTSSKKLESSGINDSPLPKVNTRFVTMNRANKTYPNDLVISGTANNSTLLQSSFDEIRSEIPLFRDTSINSTPKRKLSVFHRSFEIDSLQQESDKIPSLNESEKKRPASTSDAGEIEQSLFDLTKESCISNDQTTSYRCYDNSDLSNNDDSFRSDDTESPEILVAKPTNKLIIAPTKFKQSDTIVKKPSVTYHELGFTPIASVDELPNKRLVFDEFTTGAQESKLISSSTNLFDVEENDDKNEESIITLNTSKSELVDENNDVNDRRDSLINEVEEKIGKKNFFFSIVQFFN